MPGLGRDQGRCCIEGLLSRFHCPSKGSSEKSPRSQRHPGEWTLAALRLRYPGSRAIPHHARKQPLLDPGCYIKRLHDSDGWLALIVAPLQEPRHGAVVGSPRVRVADVGREEFREAAAAWSPATAIRASWFMTEAACSSRCRTRRLSARLRASVASRRRQPQPAKVDCLQTKNSPPPRLLLRNEPL